MSLIGAEIQPFQLTAYHEGGFVEVSEGHLLGRWSVPFSYPADFTFVCPTELGDFADQDPAGVLTRSLGVPRESEGLADRATFAVDPERRIQIVELHAPGVGRSAAELLRKVKAAQHVAAHPGEAGPAPWREGDEALVPSPDRVGRIERRRFRTSHRRRWNR